jgi:uncharacterized protein YcgI (DUF1989 family)
MANLTLNTLMAERERLAAIIEEAATAKAKMNMLDRTIALYAGNTDGARIRRRRADEIGETDFYCPKCKKYYATRGSLGDHNRRKHGTYKRARATRKRATK